MDGIHHILHPSVTGQHVQHNQHGLAYDSTNDVFPGMGSNILHQLNRLWTRHCLAISQLSNGWFSPTITTSEFHFPNAFLHQLFSSWCHQQACWPPLTYRVQGYLEYHPIFCECRSIGLEQSFNPPGAGWVTGVPPTPKWSPVLATILVGNNHLWNDMWYRQFST